MFEDDTYYRPVYIENMACVVTNEDMCSFGYLSVVHHRMRQTSSIAFSGDNRQLFQIRKKYKSRPSEHLNPLLSE